MPRAQAPALAAGYFVAAGRAATDGAGGAELIFPTQAERTTERSGVVRASGNEVFALLDRTGTRQCLVEVTSTALS